MERFFMLAALLTCSLCISAFKLKHSLFRPRVRTSIYSSPVDADPVSSHGSPLVKLLDREAHIVKIMVTLSGQQTQRAFTQACDLYNVEVKNRGYKVPGFRPGAKLPANYLYQMFGESTVKRLCATLLDQNIQEECEKTGLTLVGKGRIQDFREDSFIGGSPHTFEVECDLWPNITYGPESGYKNLKFTVARSSFNQEKYEKVKSSIQERYKILTGTPIGYAAKLGDVVVANMKGYESASDGAKGAPLPSVASGDSVEILLEKGKFMEGLIEGLEGVLAGELRTISVQFPVRPGGAGASLSGKKAVFDVQVLEVKTKSIPNWDAELAERVRSGMTLSDLEDEVRKAIDGEQEGDLENARNEVLAKTLLDLMIVSKIPESLIDETVMSRFQNMLQDFKEQGSTEEQLAEMSTPEKYNKYKEISRQNAEKIVKLGLAFRDIAEKEKISVTESEIRDQLDLIVAQSKQKNQAPPDEAAARDEIENVLLRRKVFNAIASTADITWIDAIPEEDKN